MVGTSGYVRRRDTIVWEPRDILSTDRTSYRVEVPGLVWSVFGRDGQHNGVDKGNTDMCTFPVMLSLHDEENGHPGYFESRASVRVTKDEAQATVSGCERDWIATHRPNLKCVAFFTWDHFIVRPFERIRDVNRQETLFGAELTGGTGVCFVCC
ncbi:MAG: hypothetical protein J3R72DRAFT_524314 [Linnemannia gamsii]|nr:MAG: hypothetical protein J3R72DRAFT_524314 [Linnemannia gamsii]